MKENQCLVSSHTPPTGNLAYNPGLCPDWELNQRPFGSQASTQSTEPHQPGLDLPVSEPAEVWGHSGTGLHWTNSGDRLLGQATFNLVRNHPAVFWKQRPRLPGSSPSLGVTVFDSGPSDQGSDTTRQLRAEAAPHLPTA